MTQLELPPISIARYLDLLKRRRWQVIPISLLGLLVGGMVALFVPRYYVARTVVEFVGPVLGTASRTEDPMAAIVDSAELTIPATVPRVLEILGWPQARVEDPDERRTFIEAVRGRVKIHDLGPHEKGRLRAHLEIKYSDTDGFRSAELANKLVAVWSAEQQRGLVEKADQVLGQVNERIRIATATLENSEREIASFEQMHRLDPADFTAGRNGGLGERSRAMHALEGEVSELEGEIAALRSELRKDRAKLDETPKRIRDTTNAGVAKPLAEEIQKAAVELQVATIALRLITKAHPGHANFLRRRAQAQETLSVLLKAAKQSSTTEKANPLYATLQERIDAADGKLEGLESRLTEKRARLAEMAERLDGLPQIIKNHRVLLEKRDKARLALRDLEQERADKEARKNLLTYQDPYGVLDRAYVPQRPTDPNVTLVALAGSAVGLALAIGVILLIDVLQTTYKTVEDVSRGLPIPVLGGMSHMVTLAGRREVQVRRTRTGLVAGAFLVLTISLVTIYYVAPTRLPLIVRDALDMILGSP